MQIYLVAVAFALTLTHSICEDAVLWSNSVDVTTSTASKLILNDNVVVLALDDFTLARFSKAAHAYSNNPANQQESSVIAAIRTSKYHTSEDISSLSGSDSATIIRANNWDLLNEKFSALNLKSGYTGILVDAATLEVSRVKRIVADDIDFDSNDEATKSSKVLATATSSPTNLIDGGTTPVVVPRWGDKLDFKTDGSVGSCMLYFENITIVVLSKRTIGFAQKAYVVPLGSNGDTYKYSYECENKADFNITKPFKFTVAYTTATKYNAQGQKTTSDALSVPAQTFQIELSFDVIDGFILNQATVSGLKVSAGTDTGALSSDTTVDGNALHSSAVPFRAYFGHSFACGQTRAIFFNASVFDVFIGITFDNIQIQGSGIKAPKDSDIPQFTRITADCVGTFTEGSWMGIIVTITLVSVLMFGFLMLNSVQTMDRFDDSKQKQIVINFKE